LATQEELPALPALEIVLVARGEALASNVRLWALEALSAFQLL
jgi:hypothetical protein